MTRLRQEIALAAASDAPVFVTGESGSGKDLVIQAIHDTSDRAASPMVKLNCSGSPDDILDRELLGVSGPQVSAYNSQPRFLALAGQGTLVLDDICRASDSMQARLLRLATERVYVDPAGGNVELGARLIAATNSPPAACLRTLRRDLYDSLAVLVIDVPPLRERGSDASEIATQLFPDLLRGFGHAPQPLPPTTLATLDMLDWPGNVRQLVNVLTRMALAPQPDLAVPEDVLTSARFEPAPPEPPQTFAQIERRAILDAIARNRGSVLRASEDLGIAASTVYRKLKSWNDAP
jgi:two-component system repressor protein LuxO